MENLHNMLMGIATAAQPINLLYCFLGSLIGTLIGVLPGIGPVGAIALLLPVTMYVPPLAAFIMFTGIMYGAQYGGSTTSILVNIPGEASSVMTCLDGYQMARKGRAGPALGMTAFASFIAGTLGLFGLVFLAPSLAEFGLRFGPPEYFGLMIFGLTLVIYLARGSLAKGLMMTAFGLLLASVGLDPVSSAPRFTYGIIELRDGIGLAQMVIGLFGVSEVLLSVEKSFTRDIFETKIRGLLPNLQDWKDSIFPTLRSSVLSFLMSIIPGISVVIPTFICYSLEKRISKHPEKFGTGVIEGVAVPEAANNGAGVGSMVPLLSLGIPTGASSALVLGALLIYGLHPGPLLIRESPEVFWGVIGSMYIGNVMLLLLNLPLIRIWVSILKIPYAFLFSSIILFCLIGSYTINNGVADMYLMILFGIVGYLMKKFDYDPVPLILALVLGPMLENAFRRSMLLSDGSFLIFFTRPISGILLALALVMLVSPVFMKKRLGEDIIKETED